MENPSSSIFAKIYSFLSVLFIFSSIAGSFFWCSYKISQSRFYRFDLDVQFSVQIDNYLQLGIIYQIWYYSIAYCLKQGEPNNIKFIKIRLDFGTLKQLLSTLSPDFIV